MLISNEVTTHPAVDVSHGMSFAEYHTMGLHKLANAVGGRRFNLNTTSESIFSPFMGGYLRMAHLNAHQ